MFKSLIFFIFKRKLDIKNFQVYYLKKIFYFKNLKIQLGLDSKRLLDIYQWLLDDIFICLKLEKNF